MESGKKHLLCCLQLKHLRMMIDERSGAKKAWKSSEKSKMCTEQKKNSVKRIVFPSKGGNISSCEDRVERTMLT